MENETANAKKMKGALASDFINELMQSSRTKGTYGVSLLEFLNESDEAGINPREAWPHLYATKNAATLYQGFNNAAKKANVEALITIRKVEEDVFILHKERVTLALTADDEEENGNDE